MKHERSLWECLGLGIRAWRSSSFAVITADSKLVSSVALSANEKESRNLLRALTLAYETHIHGSACVDEANRILGETK